jgi:uncharacterized protein YjbI with pentapeptide repeats
MNSVNSVETRYMDFQGSVRYESNASSHALRAGCAQKMTPDELLQRYAAGERNFRGVNLSDEILIWADLRGADLRGANLRGANLNWANLSRVNLIGADLRGADLAWANLNNADLRWANLSEANFSAANLSGTDWSGAIMPDGTILPIENPRPTPKLLSWLLMPFNR